MTTMIAEEAGRILTTLRETKKNSVLCIVGDLAAPLVANTLEALNITPSFTHDPREVTDFVGQASGVLVQLGIMSEARESGIMTAVDIAIAKHKPWVLETRFASKSIFRAQLARRLAGYKPSIICGTSQDLATMQRSGAIADVPQFVKTFKTTCLCLGARDQVADQFRSATIDNHSPYFDNMGGMSCAMAALCAAFSIVEHNEFKATAAAALFGRIAGEQAGMKASGPGSFVSNFLDEIYSLSPQDILEHARIVNGLPHAN